MTLCLYALPQEPPHAPSLLSSACWSAQDRLSAVDRFSRDEWPHAARRVCAVAVGTRATGDALAYTGKDSGNVTGGALEAQVEVEYFPWEYFGFL